LFSPRNPANSLYKAFLNSGGPKGSFIHFGPPLLRIRQFIITQVISGNPVIREARTKKVIPMG
jgi:hypothetical protein